MRAAGVALSAFGLAASCFGLYGWYRAARFNTQFQSTNFGGPSENFGPLDAVMNFVPLGGIALVGIGIGVAWALGNLRAAALLSLAQILALIAFPSGMWIS